MKRRKFVQSTAIATAAFSTASMSFCAPESNITMPLNKKSLKFGMIKEDLSILDKFKLVKSLGFDGVEMDSPNDLDDKEIIAARDEAGIIIPGVVNSVHWKKPLSHSDPAVREECTNSMIDAFHKCKSYRGTTVLLVPAIVNDEIRYDEAWERSTAEIKKMLPVAKETGIKIAIENVWNNFLISPMEAARYIDQFDSDMIGWYMDIGNIVRYGWPHHWIQILGKRIIKVDIKDYSRKKQSEEGIWEGFKVKLGDGDSDWVKVNQALQEVGYNGWGSAEVSGGDRDRLKEISDRMDRLYAMV